LSFSLISDAASTVDSHFYRPEWKRLKKMRRGDVLYIKSIDRLGRNNAFILQVN
jgi:DNA invertase Pin-like site-specific DNA recombinase